MKTSRGRSIVAVEREVNKFQVRDRNISKPARVIRARLTYVTGPLWLFSETRV